MAHPDEQRMSVVDHLGELRKRLVISAVAILIGTAFSFIAKGWVFEVILRPLRITQGDKVTIITLSPTEPFMTVLKVSIYAGLLIALPVVLWQFWAFIMPALYENEKKRVLPYVFFTTALFLAGVLFGYYVVLPVGLKFLVGYGGDIFNQQLRASEYISFVSLFLLAFGVVFEMPAIMLMLSSAGIVNARQLRKTRKYALVGIATASMVLTPSQDPVSMLLMMGPLLVLYELGIMLARVVDRRRAKRKALAAVELE